MVIEKLKERQDKKEDREDQQILETLNSEIESIYNNVLSYTDLLKDSKEELAGLFHQYFLIKWEHHPLDHEG